MATRHTDTQTLIYSIQLGLHRNLKKNFYSPVLNSSITDPHRCSTTDSNRFLPKRLFIS